MKKFQFFALAISLLFVLGFIGLMDSAEARVRVRGHFRPSTGQFVMPHHRTSPNNTRWDNWSTRDNFNPHTGRRGTVNPLRDRSRRW